MSEKVRWSEINHLAIPAIFAAIVEPLISLTDTAVAGNVTINPEETLGAVGLVGSFISAMVWVFAQSTHAISSLISQAVGNQTVLRHRSLVSQMVILNFIIGIVLAVLLYNFSQEILELYGAKGLLLEYCLEYFKIRVWGIPFSLITLVLYGVFRGYQNTSWAMKIALTGGVLNIVLDLILVFWFDFGIQGIAYASLVAQALMFALSLLTLLVKTPFHIKTLFPFHPKMKLVFGMSGNLVIRAISLNFGILLANYFATSYGTQYLDAQSILVQIWLFSAFLMDGYANAGNAISGKLLGEKSWSKLRFLVNDLIKIMVGIGLILALIYAILYYPIGRIFTHSNEVRTLFYASFWLVLLMQPLNAVAFLYDGIYKGMGKTIVLRNLIVIATFLCFCPVIFISDYFGLKLYGIWIAFWVWMAVRAFGLMFNFKKNFTQ